MTRRYSAAFRFGETRDLAPVQAGDRTDAADHAVSGRIRVGCPRRIDECRLQHLFHVGKRHSACNGQGRQRLHQRSQSFRQRRLVERGRSRRADGRLWCLGFRSGLARGHRNSLRRRSAKRRRLLRKPKPISAVGDPRRAQQAAPLEAAVSWMPDQCSKRMVVAWSLVPSVDRIPLTSTLRPSARSLSMPPLNTTAVPP